ncbi:MAG: SH3 domain-containing protein [bacterium]|nr:SH3 domain-containing protein [bacterium]
MKRATQIIGMVGVGLLIGLIGAALSFSAVVAQTPAPLQPTAIPTRLPPVNVTPQDLPSLSGVGGTPLQAAVRIRQAPSLDARVIGGLRYGRFIDIVGTNGFDPDRECNNFEDDLDMWVQVFFREQRGWIARCTLQIYGDLGPLPIEATPEAVG